MSSKVLKDVDIEQELLGIENECGELPNTLEDRRFTPLTLQDLGVKPDFGVNCDPGLLEIPKCYDEDDIIRQSRNVSYFITIIYLPTLFFDVFVIKNRVSFLFWIVL